MMRDKNKGVEETRDGQKIGQQDTRQKNGEIRCEMRKKWGDETQDEKKMGKQDV